MGLLNNNKLNDEKIKASFLFKDIKKMNIIVLCLVSFLIFAFVFFSSYAVFSSVIEGQQKIKLSVNTYGECYNNGEYLSESPGDAYSKIDASEKIITRTSDTPPEGYDYVEKTVYRTREDQVVYNNWSDWSDTSCDVTESDVCENATVYSSYSDEETYGAWSEWSTTVCDVTKSDICETTTLYSKRSTRSKVISAQCSSGSFVKAANAVQGSCASTYCPSGTLDINNVCYTKYADATTCEAACGTTCQYDGSYYCSTIYSNKLCAGYNYTYDCSDVSYTNPTYGNECKVGLSGTNCVVTENYSTTSCPTGTTEVSGVCYTAWSEYTTEECNVGNTCQATTGYRTRSKTDANEWSEYTTEVCDTSNDDACQSINGYRTRAKAVDYTEWSDWSETPCDTTNTGYCESKVVYEYNITLWKWCLPKGLRSTNITTVYAVNENAQEFVAPITGYYFIELNGAAGGGSIGGNGANTSGYVFLNKNDKLYVYVGSRGKDATSTTVTGGYNGGGTAIGDAVNVVSGSGGGATDIRYFGNYEPTTSELAWNSSLGLNSRIMVAAGGGGGARWTDVESVQSNGGAGGTLIGHNGIKTMTSTSNGILTVASGGTQRAGGAGTVADENGSSGSFGIGGTGNKVYGGGGAGYYGGGGGGASSYTSGSGAGGSSFISGYAGVNAITSATSTTATNDTKHYSGMYFIKPTMQSGVKIGDGSAKITYVSQELERVNTKLDNVRYIKDCINGNSVDDRNMWLEIQAIHQGKNIALNKLATTTSQENQALANITDGIMDDITIDAVGLTISNGEQCAIIDLGANYNLDEIAIWHWFADGRTFNNNKTYVSSDNDAWTIVLDNQEVETVVGKRINAYNK